VPERLEDRHLLSVTLPGITATDPTDGASLYTAPPSFTITFDQSVVNNVETAVSQMLMIDPDQVFPTILGIDSQQDVEIDRVGADGSLTPYAGGDAPNVQESITTTTVDGTTETQLVVTPGPGTPAMQPGTYQLEILPQTALAWGFGSVTDGSWSNATDPIPIADFTLNIPGIKLAAANELGTVGATPQTVWGSLEPSDPRSAVELYRFTLPAGGPWQLDAQVLAYAVGSHLPAALSLFGPDGSVLATRDAGTGPLDDPIDPELFRDLPGGTYTLGVSAALNLPGTAQGYDPIAGIPGIAGVNQPAGVFELEVSAIPAVPPAGLVHFDLEHADPLEPAPTGLDLTFSQPVDISPLTVPDHEETALTVVDASGKTWPITAVDEQDSGEALRFIFDEALPPGSYSLVAPSQGGLTDLAGNPVVGPAGNPPGVLATWTVAAPTGPSDPNNLGVLWPGPANVTIAPGIARTETIAPGQQVDERFVIISPGFYTLQTQIGTGAIDVRIVGADGNTVLNVAGQSGLNHSVFEVGTGIYELRMTADGSEAASVAWLLRALALDYEKIATNGVGQAPALTLALAGPVPGPSEASGNPGGSGPSSTVAAATETAPAQAPASATVETTAGATTTGAVATASGSPAAALLLTPETNLAGLPTADAWQTTAVGPLADAAMVALADAGRGLPPGMLDRPSSSGTDPLVGEGSPPAGPEPTLTAVPSGAGPAATTEAIGPAAASARADAMALATAQADPLVRIAGWFAGRLPAPSVLPREPEAPATEFGATLLAAAAAPGDVDSDGPARDRSRATLAQADLGVPFALLVGTALTYRLSQPVRKWWRRQHSAHPTFPRPHGWARAGVKVPRV
jgi:hypothetical protein